MARIPAEEGRRALEVLVCFDGAVLAAHQLLAGQSVALGEGSEFPIGEAAPGGRLTAAGIDELGAFIQFPDGAQGDVTVGGTTRPLGDLVGAGYCPRAGEQVRRYALPPEACANFQVGPLTVLVNPIQPAARIPQRLQVDWRAHRFTAVAATGFGLMLLLAFLIPPDAAMASSDLMRLDRDTIRTRFTPSQLDAPKTVAPVADKRLPDASTGVRGKEGRAGDPRSKDNKRVALKGHDKETRIAGGTDVAAMVKTSGILQILGDHPGGALGQLFDRDATALGQAAVAFQGTLDGLQPGSGWGTEGGGLVGAGGGGGCTGPNCFANISVGDTICPGGRCGGGPNGHWGPSVAKLTARTHVPERVDILRAEVKVQGGIDKEVIRRVIHSHMNEIKFCYERELPSHPQLEGKVAVAFLIMPGGRVTSAFAKENTMGNLVVPRCVAEAVGRLTFPMPQNGSIAQVSYPFLFRHAGNSATE